MLLNIIMKQGEATMKEILLEGRKNQIAISLIIALA